MRFDSVECGMRIRSLRENRGFTRIQFAEQISISPDHLKAIERGKRASSIDLLAEISITFDISLNYLILGKIQEKDSIKEELHKVIDVLERFKREL